MDKKINLLAIVPARKGSKRIKDKNLQRVGNKSLVYRTIRQLQKSDIEMDIVISTDCEECLEIANKLGIVENSLRINSISGDTASTDQVVEYELERFFSKHKYLPKYIGIYQPTSPFRSKKHIEESFNKIVKSNFKSLVSVCYVGNKHIKFSYKNSNFLNSKKDNHLHNFKDEYLIRNGAIYLTKSQYFLKNKKIISFPLGFYLMNQIDSINIDTHEDLNLAQTIGNNYE